MQTHTYIVYHSFERSIGINGTMLEQIGNKCIKETATTTFGDHTWGPHFGDHILGPHLGTTLGDQI